MLYFHKLMEKPETEIDLQSQVEVIWATLLAIIAFHKLASVSYYERKDAMTFLVLHNLIFNTQKTFNLKIFT